MLLAGGNGPIVPEPTLTLTPTPTATPSPTPLPVPTIVNGGLDWWVITLLVVVAFVIVAYAVKRVFFKK